MRASGAPSFPSLTERRQALQVRSALLREQLAADVEALAPLGMVANQVQDGALWVKRHSLWVGAAVALLVVWRPRKTLSAGWRLWGWWQTARRWADFIKKMRA